MSQWMIYYSDLLFFIKVKYLIEVKKLWICLQLDL